MTLDKAVDVASAVPSPFTAEDVTLVAEAGLPTRYGELRIAVFEVAGVPTEIVAILRGEGDSPPLVRLHSECLTGDSFGSLRCDCGEQLEAALEQIAAAPRGILLYLRQEGRGIGLINKVRAYALQDRGLDTVDANLALGLPVDSRDYAPAAAVLRVLGATEVFLLTNNPTKCQSLEQHGVRVLERIPLVVPPNPANLRYIHTKISRMGHVMSPGHGEERLRSGS
jgi:GTP cyclohydrolase II